MTSYSNWSALNRWLAVVAVVLGSPMLPSRLAAQSWYNSAWTNRKAITIDHTKVAAGSSLSSFPMLFSVTDGNLKTVGNGGSVGRTDGTDILFTASDGVTKLNHEIELYNGATGQLIAWVNLPALSGVVDTLLYVYYGNASAGDQQNRSGVWDSNHQGVWHMGETSGTTLSDATSNGRNASKLGANNPAPTAGFIGSGQTFVGTANSTNNDYASFAATATSSVYTVEFWMKQTSRVSLDIVVAAGADTWSSVYLYWYPSNQLQMRDHYNALDLGAFSSGVWHHLAVVRNGDSVSSYIDGALAVSAAGGGINPEFFSQMGFAGANPSWNSLNGQLDELRISNTARPAAWIGTEYNNQNAPSTFYSVGGQQSGVAVTVTTAPAGLSLTVDSGACTAPCTFQWTPGSSHTIGVTTTPQAGVSGTQYLFASWSDSGAQTHSITGPAAAATYTANFNTQYFLTTAATTGGTITPSSGWINAGTPQQVNATANAGYQFAGFTGALSGTTTPQSVTMNGPATVTANFSALGGPGWYGVGGTWTNRMPITIHSNQVSGASNLVNFPVLFSVTNANLKTVGNLGGVGRTDGKDILFTSSDGTTKLDHELEAYDGLAGAVTAWVRIQSLSPTTDTVLYIYYGNASAGDQQNSIAVWDGNFKGVWHMSQNPNGAAPQLTDSTSNGLNVTTVVGAGSLSSVAGKAGNSVLFHSNHEYSGSYASSASASGMGTGNDTLSGWVNFDTLWPYDSGEAIFFGTYLSGNPAYQNGISITNLAKLHVRMDTSDWNTYTSPDSSVISAGTWYYVVGTYNAGVISLYVNGSLVGSTTQSFTRSDGPVFFNRVGNGAQGGVVSDIRMDELRISNTARSAAWIGTEYANQNSPLTFYSVGGQQSSGSGGTVTVTVTSAPAGLSLTVDNGACTAPCTFQWTAGLSHTIAVTTTPQGGTSGTQYAFASWSDSGAQTHQITAPSSSATYTANFTTQYALTTTASPTAGGTISPASNWYSSGAVVPMSASANSGYQFTGFTGALSGTPASQNLTMTGPATVTANFASTAPVPITIYGTGVGSSGVLASDGAVDSHYTLFSSADPATPGPNLFVVNSTVWPLPSPWIADGPNSKWIGPYPYTSGAVSSAAGLYTYRTTFNLTGNPATAVLTGQYASDDIASIQLNGVTVGTASQGFSAFQPFTINSGFVAGVNNLDFVVQNAVYGGTNPTGLRVDISGTVGGGVQVTLNPPGPVSLSASQSQQFTANTAVTWAISPAVGTMSNGLYTAPSSIAAAQSVTVTATNVADSSKTATATVNLTPTVQPDFSITFSYSGNLNPLTISQGGGTFVGVVVNSIGGFTGPVTLSSATGLPTGTLFYYQPSSYIPNGSGSTYLAIQQIPYNALPDQYLVTVTGTSGTITRSASFLLQVSGSGPSFNLSASPTTQTVSSGNPASFNVNVLPVSGFSATVSNFTISNLPGGAGFSFAPLSVAGSGPTTLTVYTSSSIPAGTYTLNISAAGGGRNGYTSVTLIVSNSNSYFTLSANPSPQTVIAGNAAVFPVSVAPVNGFSATVSSFGTVGLPSGAFAVFTPSSVTGFGSTNMNITTSSSTPAGTYPVTINASGGGRNGYTGVTLVVNSAGQPISVVVDPPSPDVYAAGAQQLTATVSGTTNTAVSWSLNVPVGSISQSGLYLAPTSVASAETVTVIATSLADGSRTGIAVVNLLPSAGGLPPCQQTDHGYYGDIVALTATDVYTYNQAYSAGTGLELWTNSVSGTLSRNSQILSTNGATAVGMDNIATIRFPAGSGTLPTETQGASYSLAGSYSFTSSSCLPFKWEDRADTVSLNIPIISSVAPAGAATGGSTNVTISGGGLSAPSTVYISGPDITITPQTQTDSTLQASLTVAANAQTGTRTLTMTSKKIVTSGIAGEVPTTETMPGVTSAGVNFTVGDPTPSITGIFPNTFAPGSLIVPVTITGLSFGANPTLSSSQIQISPNPSGMSWAVTSWLSNSIGLNLTVPDTTSPGPYTLTVISNGFLGSGFQRATPGQPNSAAAQVAVSACPAPQISITSRPGPNWLGANNQVNLAATINVSGRVTWTSDNPIVTFPDGQTVNTGSSGQTFLRMQVNGPGKATISATLTSGCGASNQSASDSFTFVLSDDVTAVGWVNNLPGIAKMLDLSPHVDSNLANLDSDAITCGAVLGSWVVTGNTPYIPPLIPVDTPLKRQFVNWWFEAQTGNTRPPDQIDTVSFGANLHNFRQYHRFQAVWEVRQGTIYAPSLQVLKTSALAGLTPEPCTGAQIASMSPNGEVNPFVNGHSGVTFDNMLAYQINDGRVGTAGQAVNKYLNHPDYPNPSTAMPWVWSVIQFDVNGNLRPFNNGSGAVVTTNNLAMFPTVTIYKNGLRLGPDFPQQSLDIFTPLDIQYDYRGIQ